MPPVTAPTPAYREITKGLRFPEGPVAMPDGSVLLVEIERQTLTRVAPDGKQTIVAKLPAAARTARRSGRTARPTSATTAASSGRRARPACARSTLAKDYQTRLDRPRRSRHRRGQDALHKGPNHKLNGPNDLVFDAHGGFYFTDLGKVRERDGTAAPSTTPRPTAQQIVEIAFPMITPNGCGLSPDGRTLYVAETQTGRVWAFDSRRPASSTGSAGPRPTAGGCWPASAATSCSIRWPSMRPATSASPRCSTGHHRHLARRQERAAHPDPGRPLLSPTSASAGPDLRTAFVTLSMTGRLIAFDWDGPGAKLNYLNT